MSYCEKRAKELAKLVDLSLIRKSEAKNILKYNINAHNKLISPNRSPEDFMRLVKFELEWSSSFAQKSISVWNRIILPSLCRLFYVGIQKFPANLDITLMALEFFKTNMLKKHFIRVISDALAKSPNSVELVSSYTKFHILYLKDINSARKIVLSRIRNEPNELCWWIELMKVESYVQVEDQRILRHIFNECCQKFGVENIKQNFIQAGLSKLVFLLE